MGLGAVLDGKSRPYHNSISEPTSQPLASRYTRYTIPSVQQCVKL